MIPMRISDDVNTKTVEYKMRTCNIRNAKDGTEQKQ